MARKIRWTKFAMLVEQIWLRAWLPIIIVSVFFITVLFDTWGYLNPLVHRLALALFGLTLIASFYPFLSIRWPSDKKALKRLDANSELPHHPAEAFKDHLDPRLATRETRTLWYNFKVRLVEKIRQLRIVPPSPKTYEKDPYAIRMLVLLTVAIGLFLQGGQYGPLINKVFALPPLLNVKNLRIDAWVSPPAYTGAPPFLVADGSKPIGSETDTKNKIHKAPENAILTIRINGENTQYTTLESLHHTQPTGEDAKKNADASKTDNNKAKVTKANADTAQISKEYNIKLSQSDKVSIVVDGIPLREWNFEVIEDQPPVIGLTDIPKAAASRSLNLKYRVADDYGVIGANAHIEDVSFGKDAPKGPITEQNRPLGDPPIFPLNLPKANIKADKGETFKDLTSHPWAGLSTNLYLSATDEGGNTSKSPTIRLTLPEYKFTKQMAINIIRVRKQLILNPQHSRKFAWDIDALTRVEKAFENDKALYLGLRLVERRLRIINSRKDKEEIASLLYELARRAEDGELLKAERELRAAEDALRDALRRGADASEIQKRIDDLRKALKKFMAAMARDQKQSASAHRNKRDEQARNLRQQDLERMLKNIEKLAKSGSKDLANKMLSQMQKMLENLRRDGPQNQKQQAQNSKEMQKLNELMRRQQKLMDETFQQRRKNQNKQQADGNADKQKDQQQGQQNKQNSQNQQGKNNPQSLMQQQQALRDELQKLMKMLQAQRSMGLPPLDKAARSMGQAEEFLGQKQLGDALNRQGQVLDQLKQGMDQLAGPAQDQEGYGGAKKAEGRDPLGRPEGEKGMDTSDSTEIPDEVDIQRARQILRNLQDRVSDPNRPNLEIEYFERLLKRF